MSRLAELTGKVDAFFARVTERHGADMQCGTGCSDCCQVQLTITGVEAAAIRAHVATWPTERRRRLAGSDPAGPGTTRCAALDAAGRCKIYEARPLVCRSHGAPIRLGRGPLAVVQSCHRNFTRTRPDPDCVLEQGTLSAMLLVVDATEAPTARDAPGRDACDAPGAGAPPGNHVDLAGLLAELAAI